MTAKKIARTPATRKAVVCYNFILYVPLQKSVCIEMNFILWILSMCKVRRITHKLNIKPGFIFSLSVIRRS